MKFNAKNIWFLQMGMIFQRQALCSFVLRLLKLRQINFQYVTNSVKVDSDKFTRYYQFIELPNYFHKRFKLCLIHNLFRAHFLMEYKLP